MPVTSNSRHSSDVPARNRKRKYLDTEPGDDVSIGEYDSRTIGSVKGKKDSNSIKKERDRVVESVNELQLDAFASKFIPKEVLDRKFHIRVSDETTSRGPSQGSGTKQEAGESGQATTYSLYFYSSATLPQVYFEGAFALVEYTSSSAYRASKSFGWSPRKKKEEMALGDMRYLILVRDGAESDVNEQRRGSVEVETEGAGSRRGSKPQSSVSSLDGDVGGFMSFMATYEDSLPVLYCYELHLHPCLQNRGIGKVFMQTLEAIARNIGGLQKTMLTVLRCNVDGRRFYESLRYREDEFSPKPTRLRGGGLKEWDYLIMSKNIVN